MGGDLGVGELSVWFDCGSVPSSLLQHTAQVRALNPARGNSSSENNEMEKKEQRRKVTPQKGEQILRYKASDQNLYPGSLPRHSMCSQHNSEV